MTTQENEKPFLAVPKIDVIGCQCQASQFTQFSNHEAVSKRGRRQ